MQALTTQVTRLAPTFTAVSDAIWATPELCYAEHRSVAAQIDALAAQGFAITRNIAGLDTAFTADWGTDGPVIAFLGEFDALPGLSQQAGLAKPLAVEDGGNGHGCGHNLLGAASMLAASALAARLRDTGIAARVRYYGCPAEEGGWGKVRMVAAGAFDDAQVGIGWHPGTYNAVRARATLAVANRRYRFTGRAAHAAMSPHLGRSALDAVELMNVGANYLREHMPQEARLHYAATDAGGSAPNVVQARAESLYMIRAPELDDLHALIARVDDVARGAALMTGTQVEIIGEGGAANVLPNAALCAVMHQAMLALGTLNFARDELAFAQAIRDSLGDTAAADRRAQTEGDALLPQGHGRLPLHSGLRCFSGRIEQGTGSTDVGDVSWQIPVVEAALATWAVGTPSHTWQAVAQGRSSAAHRAMIRAANVMAHTALTLIQQPGAIAQAQDELARRRGGRPYVPVLPDAA
ncbi:amidohydrolase [Pararhodobacter zhoushanensis]|uniref:Amidohydrolase n=1 Tax=Pararhodobacter zhoushanensis TaxID=2479545 RepID=A0ABT3H2D5_9RHOB|nr:amidohydrolase [Pararhodobacter zhoushanensis]MCW1933995.1 amidohydrolase [Pararhodobacter zhoushanensis]